MSLVQTLGTTFGGGGTRATIDLSEIDELRGLLAAAAENAPNGAEDLLDIEVPRVYAEAQNMVRSYPHATGETAESMGFDTEGLNRRIWAATKQAAFLEYGSPATGAPRPWLTGPAGKASTRILRQMADVGRIW